MALNLNDSYGTQQPEGSLRTCGAIMEQKGILVPLRSARESA
jgi:hypothetical protein